MTSTLRLFLSLSLSLSLFTFAYSQDSIIYSLVSANVIKGHDKVWKNKDGSYSEWYHFNDRGRGDSLRITYRESEDAIPVYIEGNGVDYMKNPVFESFRMDKNKATWKNPVENETATITNPAFYTGLKMNVGHQVLAMHHHSDSIQLLPYGTLTMKVLEHQTLTSPIPINIMLVEEKGLGYAPQYIWVDANYLEFAGVNDWMSFIRRGYEEQIQPLLEIQKKYDQNFYKSLAVSLAKPIDEWMIIRDVNIFDAKEAVAQPHKDVLIHEGMIQAITPANIIQRPEARIIDGTGLTMLPGLWDMHTHTVDPSEGMIQIACGVTHLRDMGNSEALLQKRQQFFSGDLIGPRIEVISGFIDRAGPMAAPTGTLINNLEEGLQAVRDYAAKGYQQIKLYSSIKPEWVMPLAQEAHKLRMRVCGHIPAYMTASEAVNDGYDEITHMNMLALNFFGDTIDTRTPLRFSVPAKLTAGLDLNGKAFMNFVHMLRDKHIAVDPTLNVFEELFTAKDNVVSPTFGNAVEHFPASLRRDLKAGGEGLPITSPAMDSTYKASFNAFLHMLKILYDNGIRILPGTDSYPGFSLWRELELYAQAGIPTEKVLQIATYNPAVYTGHNMEYGTIESGRIADFILVKGDPMKNISDIRNTVWVVSDNRIYSPNDLFSALSFTPW